MEHDRTCLFILMRNLHTKMFFRFVFKMFITLWALFRQSLPCQQVAAAAAATTASARWKRPIVLTHVLDQNWYSPSSCVHTAARRASSFDFLCSCFIFIFSIECGRCSSSRSPAVLSYSLSFLMSSITQGIDVHPSWRLCSIRAGTYRWFATVLLHFMILLSISCTSASSSVRLASAAAAFSLLTRIFAFFLVSCVSFPFVAAAFYCVNDFLASFFELGHFNTDVFLLGRVHHTQSCLVFLFIFDVDVLPKHGDHESSHDTSVVNSQMDHVVGLGIFSVSQISSLGQNVVN